MVFPLNRPSLLRTGVGQITFGIVGVILTLMLFYFGFRLFYDNGFWGLLQLVVVAVVAGFFSRLSIFHNALVPYILSVACLAQAVKIW